MRKTPFPDVVTFGQRIDAILTEKTGRFPRPKEALRRYWRHEKEFSVPAAIDLLETCEAHAKAWEREGR